MTQEHVFRFVHVCWTCKKTGSQYTLTVVYKHVCSDAVILVGCSLSRYKLKFSPDKVDTMIVQAISLLDDVDKELNNYVMRAREWYGWHFPELGKIITDNLAFVKAVKLMGNEPFLFLGCLSQIFR